MHKLTKSALAYRHKSAHLSAHYFRHHSALYRRIYRHLIFGTTRHYIGTWISVLYIIKKAPCQNQFQAIMNALLASKACDRTGVVGIACARHGCYAPNSLVDIFLGEQQKIVDFGVLMAILLTHVDPDQGLLLIYDIACQYIIHFFERIGIHLPKELIIEAAIGLFHVHAHKDDCFFRFATSFIPGAGIVAGEILESLWSTLNSIFPTARTATLAHRAEMLDDHTTDSNNKKMLGMVSSLCKNNRKAINMLEHAQSYYDNLTIQAGPIAVAKWNADIEGAEASRKNYYANLASQADADTNADLAAMDIYAAKIDKGRSTEPLPAELDSSSTALERWMTMALAIEEKQ